MIRIFIGLSLLSGLLLVACSKSTIVGSEILSDDFVDVVYTDTFKLNTLNVEGDSARIYPSSNAVFLLGSIEDPVFGNTSTEMYIQVRKLFDIPDMEDVTLDSVVLSLGVNSLAFWGDSLAEQSIEVYELGESLMDRDSIYSNEQFSKGALLGSRSYFPIEQDSATVFFRGDTFYYPDILRIPLDQSYGEKLLADTTALQNDTLIQELTNGFVLKSTASTSAVFGVRNSVFLDDYTNKVMLYFTRGDTTKLQHALTLGGKKGFFIENMREGSVLKDYLNNEEGSDSLLFISGMVNNDIELEIPNLDGLKDVMINYAELEFTIHSDIGNTAYSRVDQIYAFNIDEEGQKSFTYDLNISLLQSTSTLFDGTIEEVNMEDGSVLKKYNINITNELKRRIEEEDTSTVIKLIPALSVDRAYRSVLYGPSSSRYPAKLKITYTQK